MSVHYKFKSNLNYDTVTFDGLHISVADLKKSIMQQKKIGKSSDFDLQITNAQTKEVYDNEEALVPKNTSVIVARVPVASGNKKNWEKPELPLPLDIDEPGQIRFDKLVKSADLANANVTEDDKVKAMISQSSQEYDPSKYVKSRSMTGPLPPTYTCYRCGKQGHWIKNCPTNNPDVKRSTGIPRSFMVPVDGPEHKGALLTSSGEYAVPIIDHQAYKEVKKEKPPFVPEPEQAPVPAVTIPEELLCVFCKNLLQDAVLIPCCGNSFCDECVRQALLDSDNHECPLCHEVDISPDTVIPNRFLRTAVLNYKNSAASSHVEKLFPPPTSSSDKTHFESPQPSPDSTVETQPPPLEIPEVKAESSEVKNVLEADHKAVAETPQVDVDETPELTQPGTPLADEPEDDMSQPLPIEIIGRSQYDDYHPVHYAHGSSDTYEPDSRDASSDHGQISTIETITNIRKTKFSNRLPPMPSRQHFPPQVPRHHQDRPNDYEPRDRPDYRPRYDRRNVNGKVPARAPVRPQSRYERSPHDTRYHHHQSDLQDYHEYASDHDRGRDFEAHSAVDQSRRRPRYASPPQSRSSTHPSSYPVEVAAPTYVPAVTPAPHQSAALLPTPQATFPAQPPPPGASPIDSSTHISPQPPPPGVGPLLPVPPSAADSTSSGFGSQSLKAEESKVKTEESIDERLEAFQRELEKRGRECVRDRTSRSSSRSRTRNRSRSSSRSSHSRSYTSSKSWSRSPSRSISRSRSRSRSTYSSRRSRSRSFSRSRSRSRSKSRSFSRSPTRSRSKSRSRSRERERERHRTDSRERLPTPFARSHSASHSPSPRNFHQRSHRSPYPVRRSYNPPSYNSGYTVPYTTAPSVTPLPTPYAPDHIHSIHPIQPLPVSHPIDHYPAERRYHYNDQYPGYDIYQQQQPKPYSHPRYDREQRNTRFEAHSYQRRPEEVPHRIPGWVGDRSRQDYKPRFRMPRDQQRKEIKELPKVPDITVPPIRAQKSELRVKESKEEVIPKRKEERLPIKHKKHHHHRPKETKKVEKQESKVTSEVIDEKPVELSNLINVEVLPEKVAEQRKAISEPKIKPADKVKEKKHKHKKHKTGDSTTKKKKAPKKEKLESGDTDIAVKVKTKKKKNKVKAVDEGKKRGKATFKHQKQIQEPEEQLRSGEADTVTECVEATSTGSRIESLDIGINEIKAVSGEPVAREAKIRDEQTPSDTEPVGADGTNGSEDVLPSVSNTPDVPEGASPCEGVEEDDQEEEPDEAVDAEEMDETPVEDELHVEVPELSKWEREEYEEDMMVKPQRKSAVVVPKEEKGYLSSDIIQRAEKVILHKPLKTAIVVAPSKASYKTEKASSKTGSADCSPTTRTTKYKDQVDTKTTPSTERQSSPILQVTISTDKEKRSVQTKDSNARESAKTDSSSKRVKLDRSNFASISSDAKVPQVSSRTVVVEKWSNEPKKHDEKWKLNPDKKTKPYPSNQTKSRDKASQNRKEDSSSVSRQSKDSHYRHRSREDRDRRYDSSERRPRDTSSSRRPPDHSDRSRKNPSNCSSKRHGDSRDSYRNEERTSRDARYKRSRSNSYDSSESYNSSNKRHHSKRHTDSHYEKSSSRQEDHSSYEHRQKSSRKSPVSKKETEKKSETKSSKDYSQRSHTRHISHDESKFEPDYDEFSDIEENDNAVSTEKQKRNLSAAEVNRKRVKVDHAETSSSHVTESKKVRHRTEKSSTPTSLSSSSPSESDSSENKSSKNKESDSDHKPRHKRTRHKKHKKHKHKHKKKKSHKSKQRD